MYSDQCKGTSDFFTLTYDLTVYVAGAGRDIPDLNSVANGPRGDGRRLLVQDHGINLTPAKLRRLTDKEDSTL